MTQSDLKTKSKSKTQKPKQYAVVMQNDDFTPMEFVVAILVRIFKKTAEEAEQLMMEVHKKGKGVAGIYTLEIAETKALIAEQYAVQNEHPFRLSVEEA